MIYDNQDFHREPVRFQFRPEFIIFHLKRKRPDMPRSGHKNLLSEKKMVLIIGYLWQGILEGEVSLYH